MLAKPFHGAKVALFVGDALLVKLRDDIAGIDHPGYWDFPGGGREGNERPIDTVIRETQEEVSLTLAPQDIVWSTAYPAATKPGAIAWFFVAQLMAKVKPLAVLGDEGQRIAFMSPGDYLVHPKRIPFLANHLAAYLDSGALGRK